MLALTQSGALVVLFVFVPIVVGGAVMVFVARSGGPPPGTRTSEVLASGQPAQAEILAVRTLGTVLDLKPMMAMTVRVSPEAGEPFELKVVQSVPRRLVHDLRLGETVQVRYLVDRSAAAVVLE